MNHYRKVPVILDQFKLVLHLRVVFDRAILSAVVLDFGTNCKREIMMQVVFVQAFIFFCLLPMTLVQDEDLNSLEKHGKVLFERKWKPNDELSPNGDGLGPMFNADSCATCHPQGGGEGNQFNVQLLTLVSRHRSSEDAPIPRDLNRMIPFFEESGESTTILHRHSTDKDFVLLRKELFEERLQRSKVSRTQPVLSVRPVKTAYVVRSYRHYDLVVSERNSPSLLGLKWIDEIDAEAIKEVEFSQRGGGEISGRIALTSDGKIGRFGWRGQTASLKDFVANACAAEMGLQQNTRPQSLSPLQPNTRMAGIDMDESQVEALVAFVETFPRPKTIPVRLSAQHLRDGRGLFSRLDCAVCHVKQLGGVDGIYSDLLLHDMGSGLADPVSASPHVELSGKEMMFLESGGGFSYFGGNFTKLVKERTVIPSNVMQEWQTPPLWGLADTAPYLHDGRAETIDLAIRLHGGEAARSAEKYSQLASNKQKALISFLRMLRAR